MLNWITSRLKQNANTSSHPLATEAGIAEWIADQPATDPQRVLLALHEWFSEPEQLQRSLTLAQMLRAIDALDSFAQGALKECWEAVWQDTGRSNRASPPIRSLETYYQNSHQINLLLFKCLLESNDLRDDRKLILRHALRAMYAGAEGAKLARMHYREPDRNWWLAAHAVNRLARDLGILYQAQPVFGRSANNTSIWKEYFCSVLLETAPVASLTATEIEATQRVVRMVEPYCQYTDTASAQTPFHIDPEAGTGPVRTPAGATLAEHVRHIGIGEGHQQLHQIRAHFAGEPRLPDWLGSLGLKHAQVKLLLGNLINAWSTTPPKRSQARRRSKGTIRVVHSLEIARRMVAASDFARSGRTLDYEGYIKSLTARHRDHSVVAEPPPPPKTPMETMLLLETAGDQQMMEEWEVVDMSTGGLGVRFGQRRSWLSIGTLLGFRFTEEMDWQIGVVKRLSASHGRYSAGLTTLGDTPQVSQVRLPEQKLNDPWSGQTQETSGLGWRDSILASADECLILTPPGTFAPRRRVEISVGGRFRPATLADLIVQGAGYELIRYEEIPQS